ncbi:hypothetical protein FS749_000016 [Ceratobasidium sp. UAMH 11750]|nr:hypothetical protein FS749_000016 [Ceratobasidium sp. UAMH 11750]
MSAGVNYVGGRGRIAPRQSKNIERVPKEHFAKQRFIDYTQTAQGGLNTQDAKRVFTMSFKHAAKNYSEHDRTSQKSAASTGTQFGACFGPRVASRPSKPTNQSRLLEMMDSEIRRGESFDASRSRISTMDTKRFAGLDIFPRKRKAGIDERDHPQRRSHTAFTQGSRNGEGVGTHAFILPPAEEPGSVQPTERDYNEEILSSDVPSVSNGMETSQPPIQALPLEELGATKVQNGANLPATYVDHPSQARPASPIIPPNLWARAYLQAARTLGLPNSVVPLDFSPTSQGTPAGISVDHLVALDGDLSSNSAEDDARIYAFNLVAPDLEAASHGAPAEPVATFVTAASPKTYLSDLPDSNEFEYDSPVIIPAPGHGVLTTVDSQNSSGAVETAPHGKRRVLRPRQTSDFDNRIGRDALASPPESHHVIGGLSVIQQTSIRSQYPWLGTSNKNAVGTIASPQIPSPWNTPNAKQAGRMSYQLEPSQEAPKPDAIAESSQGSTEFMRPNSTNSFNLFGEDSDGDSDS